MSTKLEKLCINLNNVLGERIVSLVTALGEVTLVVAAADYSAVAKTLHDHPDLRFEQLIDLCGVDYAAYGETAPISQINLGAGSRFAAVSHLVSISNNWRLRLRVFAADNDMPVVDSVTPIWNSANWFEREAFDHFGIIFEGHSDLRRIMTDYGFIGHPYRKDFPVSGYVEMIYDANQKRVVYQPVTIEPREVTPRIIREENYGNPSRG
ncbi:MAG: NADH-quinone oxidoreductase subunit C [Georgfuchsia sp.]